MHQFEVFERQKAKVDYFTEYMNLPTPLLDKKGKRVWVSIATEILQVKGMI